MLSNLAGWHLVILIGVMVLLFGAKKLPEAARSLGQSARVFKGEMRGLRNEDKASSEPSQPALAALPAGERLGYPGASPRQTPADRETAQGAPAQRS